VQLVHEDDCAAALVAIVRSRRPGALNVAADGTLSLAEAIRKLGTRAMPVPVAVLYAAAWLAWKLRLTFIAEAPPDFVWFISYPWLISNRRLKEELGFRFRYDCAATLDAYVMARNKRRSAGETPRPAA
jgi:UDP-glucose 4-epimerase